MNCEYHFHYIMINNYCLIFVSNHSGNWTAVLSVIPVVLIPFQCLYILVFYCCRNASLVA